MRHVINLKIVKHRLVRIIGFRDMERLIRLSAGKNYFMRLNDGRHPFQDLVGNFVVRRLNFDAFVKLKRGSLKIIIVAEAGKHIGFSF